MSAAINGKPSVETEKTPTHDIHTGSTAALLQAGIITKEQLTPQSGRRKGFFGFMPDGSPVPEGAVIPSSLPGTLAIQISANGSTEARLTVSIDQRRSREDAAPTLHYRSEYTARYKGTRARLVRDGIPDAWMEGLPLPGKKRGWRTFYEGEQKIEVSVSELGFSIRTMHIDDYRSMGRDTYLRARAEYGLPLIVRKHLTLVWSAPERRAA